VDIEPFPPLPPTPPGPPAPPPPAFAASLKDDPPDPPENFVSPTESVPEPPGEAEILPENPPPLANTPSVVTDGAAFVLLNQVSPPALAAEAAPILTYVVALAISPVTDVDLAYAPPPPPVVLMLVLPPAPIASTDTNDPKSAGTVNVVPEVMNTLFNKGVVMLLLTLLELLVPAILVAVTVNV
jgi:hypothetical protein